METLIVILIVVMIVQTCIFTYANFVDLSQKRESAANMAVLLQANRYRRDDHVPSIYRMPNPKELGRAIDFAYEYMKVFGKR